VISRKLALGKPPYDDDDEEPTRQLAQVFGILFSLARYAILLELIDSTSGPFVKTDTNNGMAWDAYIPGSRALIGRP